MSSASNTASAATILREAQKNHAPVLPLRGYLDATDVERAYDVQNANTEYWIDEGRRVTGRKIGLTAKSVQQQLGVNQPDYGILFADMAVCEGDDVPTSRLIQPKIEGEVAFILGKALDRPDVGTADLIAAIEYAVPAFEIVDSRIADWKISIADTIADNASSALYMLGGTPRKLDGLDLWRCGMVVEHRGEPVSVGAGAACLGHPLNAVVWLARKMAEIGRPLQAGDVILSGALGPMVNVTPGEVYELRISGLGSVRAAFSNN